MDEDGQNVQRSSTDPGTGTSFVYDDASRPNQDGELDSRVKYDRSGPVPIILVPQPSDDPNDPLVRRLCQNKYENTDGT